MALIIRIDVDRPYGRNPLFRHVLSRVSSGLYFPRVPQLGYLSELMTMLAWLNAEGAHAYVFFRRCTLPSSSALALLEAGRHEIGLHLENSRSFTTFEQERHILERHIGTKVRAVSKHGSGRGKFGLRHYPPYEPERYIAWASDASMRLFLGNFEDPTLEPITSGRNLLFYPSAFWLEPHWRDTKKFSVDWLLDAARDRDIVLLVHPENVLSDASLVADFKRLIRTLESRVLQ